MYETQLRNLSRASPSLSLSFLLRERFSDFRALKLFPETFWMYNRMRSHTGSSLYHSVYPHSLQSTSILFGLSPQFIHRCSADCWRHTQTTFSLPRGGDSRTQRFWSNLITLRTYSMNSMRLAPLHREKPQLISVMVQWKKIKIAIVDFTGWVLTQPSIRHLEKSEGTVKTWVSSLQPCCECMNCFYDVCDDTDELSATISSYVTIPSRSFTTQPNYKLWVNKELKSMSNNNKKDVFHW